jgi:adenylosuccinate synthase
MALTPFSSRIIADTGISMGDEGKGRLIPEVIHELQTATGRKDIVPVVLKVNGGANSGHTVAGLKLNLLPGGVVELDVETLALGAGVVADPHKAHWEAKPVEKLGYPVYSRLLIDERCLMSDIAHRILDLAFEDYRTNVLKQEPRGSTGRGITPAYLDEVGQFQVWYADFLAPKHEFDAKMDARMDRAERTVQHVCRVTAEQWFGYFKKLTENELRANKASIDAGIFPAEEFDIQKFTTDEPFRFNRAVVIEAYWKAGQALVKNIGDVRERVLGILNEGRYMIGEFGQAFWLDKRHGFPPNVTASHTFASEIFNSAGIPTQAVHNIGCCKAYDTKVGTHTFLTQMPDEHPLCKHLKTLEFGTTTGRQRMVGWCDCVEKADALRYGGYQDIVINKLDALSPAGEWIGDELLVCTGYADALGAPYSHVPRNDALRKTLKPVYARLPGWTEDISKVRSFAELPQNARNYIAFVMKTIVNNAFDGKVPSDNALLPNLRYIGVGPDPSQIIKDVPATAELIKLV